MYEFDASISSTVETGTRHRAGGTSTAEGPLSPALLDRMHRYWQAANYLTVGQIYLLENPLLGEPLRPEHIKPRLLGHWGTSPGLSFVYVHLNRLIAEQDVNMIPRRPRARGARDHRERLPRGHLLGGLDDVFTVENRCFVGTRIGIDNHVAPDGRVMEVLSEHLSEGWLEGYLLTGRHGLFASYEAFAMVPASTAVQHAKWLAESAPAAVARADRAR